MSVSAFLSFSGKTVDFGAFHALPESCPPNLTTLIISFLEVFEHSNLAILVLVSMVTPNLDSSARVVLSFG